MPKESVRTIYGFSYRHLAGSVLVPTFLLVPFLAHAGFFTAISGMFGEESEAAYTAVPMNAQTIPLLRAATHADPNPSKGGGDIIIDAGALVPEQGPEGLSSDAKAIATNGTISVHVVREAETLSQIAALYDVSVNTILWANDIKSANLIKPGMSLVILPVSGVRHVVKSGDTLAVIAKKYKGTEEDIIAYNGLASAEDIRVGQAIVIPGGMVEAPPKPKVAPKSAGSTASGGGSSSGFSHPVPGAVRTQGIHGYNGVDLGAANGTAVRAAASGEVIISKSSGWNGGYGNYIVIKHPNGAQTLYAHLSANSVGVGAQVAQGETIGAVGSTGRSTGAHLHFEVRGASNPF